MKKISIIGLVIALVAASVLLWQQYKHPSDVKLSRRITGGWTHLGLLSLAISPKGDFSVSIGPENDRASYQGTWKVKHEELVMTIANTHGTKSFEPASVGSVGRFKIIHLNEHELIYEKDGETMVLSR